LRGCAARRDNAATILDDPPNMARYFALVPAAGSGSRMGATVPKQYQLIHGKPMLWHALRALCGHSRVECAYVVLSPQDAYFEQSEWSDFAGKLKALHCGGAVRAESVLNGLQALEGEVSEDDWVLVHDAARPCLTRNLIDKLIDAVGEDRAGGILAIPVADTLKRADHAARIAGTEARAGLWLAQTPQMFPYGRLLRALEAAPLDTITDEAGALEAQGVRPRLVEGSDLNVKVTRPEDLTLAEVILKAMNRQDASS